MKHYSGKTIAGFPIHEVEIYDKYFDKFFDLTDKILTHKDYDKYNVDDFVVIREIALKSQKPTNRNYIGRIKKLFGSTIVLEMDYHTFEVELLTVEEVREIKTNLERRFNMHDNTKNFMLFCAECVAGVPEGVWAIWKDTHYFFNTESEMINYVNNKREGYIEVESAFRLEKLSNDIFAREEIK